MENIHSDIRLTFEINTIKLVPWKWYWKKQYFVVVCEWIELNNGAYCAVRWSNMNFHSKCQCIISHLLNKLIKNEETQKRMPNIRKTLIMHSVRTCCQNSKQSFCIWREHVLNAVEVQEPATLICWWNLNDKIGSSQVYIWVIHLTISRFFFW